jgi:hypothetical protein
VCALQGSISSWMIECNCYIELLELLLLIDIQDVET